MDRHGLRPRDDKGGGICDDNNWRKGTVRAYFSLFTLLVPSLGSFGLAPPQAKTFLAYSLLAFLETDTEADVGAAVARGVAAAPS